MIREPRVRAALVIAAALIGAGVATGCVTPSIPIPPPEAQQMTFALDAGAGSASFSYGPEASYADATVYVFNRDQGRGIITTANDDGSVDPTPPFPAAVGDQVAITFDIGDAVVSRCVRVRDGQPSALDYCD